MRAGGRFGLEISRHVVKGEDDDDLNGTAFLMRGDIEAGNGKIVVPPSYRAKIVCGASLRLPSAFLGAGEGETAGLARAALEGDGLARLRAKRGVGTFEDTMETGSAVLRLSATRLLTLKGSHQREQTQRLIVSGAQSANGVGSGEVSGRLC